MFRFIFEGVLCNFKIYNVVIVLWYFLVVYDK